MTSVAYGVKPEARPGWIRTGVTLVLGWIVSYATLGVLVIIGALLGVLHPGGRSWPHVFATQPFPDSGSWSLAANASAVAIVLLLSTVLTAAVVRDRIGPVSEWCLLGILILTGWAPFLSAAGGFFAFVVAVWLVRRFALGGVDRLPRGWLLAVGIVLALVVASYGLLHPLWTSSGTPIVSGRDVIVDLDNAGHASVTIRRVTGGPVVDRVRGTERRIAGGGTTMVAFHIPRGACASELPDVRVSYRVLGGSFSERLPVQVPAPFRCP